MWTQLDNGKYVTEMSTWSGNKFPDPITNQPVYGSHTYLTEVPSRDGDAAYWEGMFPSGAEVLIFND